MTKQETISVLALLEANYQPFKNLNQAIELWSAAFAEDRFEFVQLAVMAIVQTDPSEFRPNVAKVRRKMHDIIHGAPISETEAWLLVKNSLHEAQEEPETLGGAKRAWDKLPAEIQRLVTPRQLLDWNGLETGQLDMTIQPRFMRSYNDILSRKYEQEVLPKGMLKAFDAIRDKLGLYTDPDKKAQLPQPEKPKRLAYEKPEWMIRREEDERRRAEEAARRAGLPDPEDDPDVELFTL